MPERPHFATHADVLVARGTACFAHLACVIVLLVGFVSACGRPDSADASAEEAVKYVAFGDTAAVVGGVDEANPLFLYSVHYSALLDDSTLVNSEPGRLVVANMISGQGWERENRSGDEGPGEFGGDQPNIFPYQGELFGVTISGVWSAFSASGAVRSSGRAHLPLWRTEEITRIAGVAGDRIVTSWFEPFRRDGPSEQTLRQGLRVHDLTGEVLLDVDYLPGIVRRVVAQDQSRNSTRSEIVQGDVLLVEARGTYIAYKLGNTLATMTPEGVEIARLQLPWQSVQMRMDAAERIWLDLAAGEIPGVEKGNVTLVLDRELNELFRINERGLVSASANAILASKRDSLGTRKLVLLRPSDTTATPPKRE